VLRREFLIGLCAVPLRPAATPDALDLAKRSDLALRGKTQIGKAAMTVRRPEWERTLEMNFWSVNPDKSFILITSPAKEAGTGTLRLKTNMWLYLPRVERTIKVPPSLMLQPWMGSDFTNDDLVRESSLVVDYTHEIAGEATAGGDACWKLVATPKPDAPVVWGKLVLLLRKLDSLPRRQEFYDDRGTLKKVMTYDDFQKTSGRYYPMRWHMAPVEKPDHETTLLYRELEFDRQIPNRVFTQQNMKRRM
jgi:outer membrane lipoprotein-sorting protein